MRITVKLLLTFKEKVKGDQQSIHLNIDRGTTIAQVLESLSIYPDEPKIILRNGRYATSEESLNAGDQITVLPPVEGG